MVKKRLVVLLVFLFSAVFLIGQETMKHSISADIGAHGLVGYNRTFKWYGGTDLKGVLHVDNIDFSLVLEALTKNVYSFGLTVSPYFEVCKNGFVFLDGTMHSRIFGIYKTYEFVYAGSVGFKMCHFSAQVGLFSKTIDAMGRSWHSLDNFVTEPFNLLYKVKISVMGFDHPWDVYVVAANYNDYEYERMWEPIFSLGGKWDFKDRWSAVAEWTMQSAGMFHGTVKYYEAVLRAGVSFRLERSGMEKSPTKQKED